MAVDVICDASIDMLISIDFCVGLYTPLWIKGKKFDCKASINIYISFTSIDRDIRWKLKACSSGRLAAARMHGKGTRHRINGYNNGDWCTCRSFFILFIYRICKSLPYIKASCDGWRESFWKWKWTSAAFLEGPIILEKSTPR
jgi:hypothetical protein